MSTRGKDKKKRKTNVTPKQLANLRPIKKGEVRNPEGGRAVSPLVRALQKFSRKAFTEVLEAVLSGDDKQLKEFMKPTQPALYRLCATAMVDAIKGGNYSLVERMTERLIGKIPDKIEVDANTRNQNISHTELAIKTTIQKLNNDV